MWSWLQCRLVGNGTFDRCFLAVRVIGSVSFGAWISQAAAPSTDCSPRIWWGVGASSVALRTITNSPTSAATGNWFYALPGAAAIAATPVRSGLWLSRYANVTNAAIRQMAATAAAKNRISRSRNTSSGGSWRSMSKPQQEQSSTPASSLAGVL